MLTLDTKNFPEGPERYAVPADRSFIFATGIENSYPTIRGRDGATVRVDQMAKSGHYARPDVRLRRRDRSGPARAGSG